MKNGNSKRRGPPVPIDATRHAVDRYVQRLAGNLSHAAAEERLKRLYAKARYVRERPGHASEYRLGRTKLIVADGLVLTVYQNRF